MSRDQTLHPLHAVAESARRVPLRGAINCRDLGGLPTLDGRMVARGRLLRSDSLAELTAADLEIVKGLELRAVYDLRHGDESAKRPNRLPPNVAALNDGIGFHLPGTEGLVERIGRGDVTAQDARGVITDMYAAAVTDGIADLRRAVSVILERGAFPALIHCTAGKDRTGLVVMVILTALDVSREVILTDYLISDRNRKDIAFMFDGAPMPPFARAAVAEMRAARPEFMRAAFDGIDRHWGGGEGFLADGLGIDLAARDALRKHLLA